MRSYPISLSFARKLRRCLAEFRYLESKLKLALSNLSPYSPIKVVSLISGRLVGHPTIVVQPILIPETITVSPSNNSILCISTPYGRSSDLSIPTIELWPLKQNKVRVLTPTFAAGQYKSIISSYKTNLNTSFPYALSVPAYLTSQFGHFIGDCLGQILYYANNPLLRGNKPLLITYPSDDWLRLLLALCPPESLYPFHPSELLSKNIMLPGGSILLPRFSPIQNLIYANHYISSNFHTGHQPIGALTANKVFLTTLRAERISNIAEVTNYLQGKGFAIVTHASPDLSILLHCLSNADVLISEQGSIHQNVLIARNKPYYLLASESSKNQSQYEASCGGIYTSYHSHLITPIYCYDESDERNLHPYSRPIRVDIHVLDQLLS